MENAYGIGVKNRYELFYDEDVDPLEIIRQQEEEKEKRKTDKSLPKDKTKNPKSKKVLPAAGVTKKAKENSEGIQTKPSENTDTSNKPRSRPFTDRTARNVRNFDESKSLEERKNFRNREDRGPSNTENRERDSENRRGRGGFRGRGRGRGRGGFFNSFENRPPRYSGAGAGGDRTSFRPFEKKDATESNNWSDMKNEFNTQKKEPESTWMDDDLTAANRKPQIDTNWGEILEETKVANVPKDGPDDKVDALNLNNETKENLPEDHTDENSKEMTLDEWKREQEAKRAVPKYNLRKPGEGEDGNQWKRVYVLKKKAEKGADDDDEEEEDEDEDELSRRGRQRQLVDIQINFNDSRRARGRGRGGNVRGLRVERSSTGPKEAPPREERREPIVPPSVSGRNFRGGMRFNKTGQQSAPKVDDWNDFPSLVTA